MRCHSKRSARSSARSGHGQLPCRLAVPPLFASLLRRVAPYLVSDLCRLRAVRRTYALIAVAVVLMSDSGARHWGYDLSRRSGIRSGVMYPVLQRMLDEGWLVDGWEDQTQAGRRK